MSVRAKFKCTSKVPIEEGGVVVGATIELEAVGPKWIPETSEAPAHYDENDPNTSFFRYTPFGSVKIGTVNAAAAKEFEIGREYHLDFEVVEAPAPQAPAPAAGEPAPAPESPDAPIEPAAG